MASLTREEIIAALLEPFDPQEVKWKAQAVKGNRALAVAFVDARHVMGRLDEVVGVDGWQDDYQIQADGSVVCKLSVKIGGEWIAKMDVGGMSEQPDGGDRMKSAFSDALKRAAVKLGIARYLYRLPHQWCDYDPAKKQFTRVPDLPAFARPKGGLPAPKAAERKAMTPAELMAYARKQIEAAAQPEDAILVITKAEKSGRYTADQLAELRNFADAAFAPVDVPGDDDPGGYP